MQSSSIWDLIFVFDCAYAEIFPSVAKDEAKGKQIQEAGVDVSAQDDTSPTEVDIVAPVGSPYTSSPVRGKDDQNFTALIQNHGRRL